MKKVLVMLAASLLFVAGCSSEGGNAGGSTSIEPSPSYADEPSNVESTETESTTSTSAPPTSPRGYTVKQIGETGYLLGSNNSPDPPYPLQFVITAIETGYQCQGPYPMPNENGQFIAVRMAITTGPNLFDATYGTPLYLSSTDFKIIGLDGVQENNVATMATFSCLPDSEIFPNAGLGPNVTVNVAFVLDTKTASGYLVFAPAVLGGGGWEITF